MGDGPFMRGFASRESIKGGTADQRICPLSEGQIPFCWGRPGTSRKASAKEQLLRKRTPAGAGTRGGEEPPEKGLIDMAELRMTADAETATPAAGAKRTVAASEKKGLAIQDLILVAVLLAAGAVLKLTVGSLLASFGMKPNFIIAAYCLAIILIRPNDRPVARHRPYRRPRVPDSDAERHAAAQHPLGAAGCAGLRACSSACP